MALSILGAAIFGSVAKGLIGKINHNKQKKYAEGLADAQRAESLEDEKTRFARLRESAIAGGFNPLTALQLGGTMMPASGHSTDAAARPFDSSPYFNGIIDSWQSYATGDMAHAKTMRDYEAETARINIERAQGGSYAPSAYSASSALPTLSDASLASASNSFRPKARNDGISYVTIRMPNGDLGQLLKSSADRLGLKNGDALMPEDMPAVRGELVGEAYNTANALSIYKNQFNIETPIADEIFNYKMTDLGNDMKLGAYSYVQEGVDYIQNWWNGNSAVSDGSISLRFPHAVKEN